MYLFEGEGQRRRIPSRLPAEPDTGLDLLTQRATQVLLILHEARVLHILRERHLGPVRVMRSLHVYLACILKMNLAFAHNTSLLLPTDPRNLVS